MEQKINVSSFKAHCLKILDNMQSSNQVITITKRNKPIAKLAPYKNKELSIFGSFNGRAKINSNIIDNVEEKWEVEDE